MHNLQFLSPVRVSIEHQIKEVDNVDEALEFLHRWPPERRGPVYNCAVNGCHAAIEARLSAEDAHKAFESFARITGILAEDAPPPAAVGGQQQAKPLTK
ncbi:DUF982 domain-containing protein [Mesorhizobium sp. KR1-2]|uniref:DUF982 domain-containing protein n=1 Tax=Mesorhizobium sp. KR1-2 TaxID=3156609 RepID=UPI0032B462E9